MKTLQYIILIAFLAVLSVSGFIGAIEFAIEFSGIAYGLMKAGLILALVWAVDKFLLKEFDTLEEIKNGNITYGVVLGSIVVAMALCIAGA